MEDIARMADDCMKDLDEEDDDDDLEDDEDLLVGSPPHVVVTQLQPVHSKP